MNDWEMKGKPALILIHMQHAIADEAGKSAFLGHAKAAKDSGIIPRQQALLKAFRDKKLPIFFVNTVTDTEAKVPIYGRFWSVIRKMDTNLPGSKDIEVISELAPLPDEAVLGNWVFGIFSNNNLEQMLKDLGVDTLVLAGIATDMAVLTSVLQASDLLYNVIVPEDASISAKAKAHDVAMNIMIPAMALVTSTEDILKHL